jgi:hypothetical protein
MIVFSAVIYFIVLIWFQISFQFEMRQPLPIIREKIRDWPLQLQRDRQGGRHWEAAMARKGKLPQF